MGGEQSATCLLRSTWLQEKREEVRIGAPFVLPSRDSLSREALYSGRIAEDSTLIIIVLSYCWDSPEHPDPQNELLGNVCQFVARLDASRRFGDHNPSFQAHESRREGGGARHLGLVLPAPEEGRRHHTAAAGQFQARSGVSQRPWRPREHAVPSVHRGALSDRKST